MIKEGRMNKGGRNKKPSCPRPSNPPKGQDGRQTMTDELGREELLKWLERTLEGWRMTKVSSHTKALCNPSLVEAINKDIRHLEQIKALIQKPEVTEEWIEEKAKEGIQVFYRVFYYGEGLGKEKNKSTLAENFIRSLYEEIPAKKATVSEELVGKWADKFDAFIYEHPGLIIDKDWIEKMLKEAGVEIAGK